MGYIAVVDYGVGNLKSIANAFRYLGFKSEISGESKVLEHADAIILPGVGAFPDAADKLRNTGLEQSVLSAAGKKPILGICLGMQLLFERGEEGRNTAGLGLIRGTVKRISTQLKLPHIGWNTLHFAQDSPLFHGIEENCAVYFVHSFAAEVENKANLLATTSYGGEVTAAVSNGSVFGCQFHPEKSGEVGLQILKNFGEMSR